MNKAVTSLVVCLLVFGALLAACNGSSPNQPPANQPPSSQSPSGQTPAQTPGNLPTTVGDFAPLNETTKVIIAEDGAASGAGFYIADSQGYFADYNIEVEFATFANSDEMLPALASGNIDVAGGVSTASFFNSIAQGIDVKIIADKGHNVEGRSYFTFVIDKDHEGVINDYKDFKGKRIAVSTEYGVDDYIFQEMLNSNGLTREDVEFVLIPDFANMLAAMTNNNIDVALQIEPLITKGEAEGIHTKFKDATDFAPKAQIAMVLGSPQFVQEKHEVAVRFMAAYIKGLRDYNDAFFKGSRDVDRIIDIMTNYTALDDKELWKKVNVTGLNPNGSMFTDDIQNQYEWYRSSGALLGDIDLHKAVDTTLVNEVLEVLGDY